MIKQNQKFFNQSLVILDVMLVIASFFTVWYIRFYSGIFVTVDRMGFKEYLIPILLALPVIIALNQVVGLYAQYRYKHIFTEWLNIVKANSFVAIAFIGVLYVTKEVHYSRWFIVLFFSVNILYGFAMRLLVRLMLRRLRAKGMNLKHCLIIGISSGGQAFIDRVKANRHWGYNVLGVLSDEGSEYSQGYAKVIGKLEELSIYLANDHVDEVFIALPLKDYEKLGFVVSTCEKSGVKTQIIPDYLKYIPARPFVEDLDGLPVINIRHVPLDDVAKKILKRSFDIMFALFALLITSPILLYCALQVKLSSPGPIFFKQERIGLNRKSFYMYKFRSMRLEDSASEKVKWTTKDDPRKTSWGTFMRKTSLDELPQFYNVLKGDMSVVGPRPERPFFVDKFKEDIPKYMIKHQVRPGITGWAQIHGWRGDTSIEKRIEFDLYYIENWSFSMDIKIVLLTVFKGFVNKNAY